MTVKLSSFYDRRPDFFVRRYRSLRFDDVHSTILDLVPGKGTALDVGAGSGRDAAALAHRNLKVYAVDPSQYMLLRASQRYARERIVSKQDSLPLLRSIKRSHPRYDFILVSAVWMHIPRNQRRIALRTLSTLLKPDGKLVITLRFGRVDPVRRFFQVCKHEVEALANEEGLKIQRATTISSDQLGRPEIEWQTLVLVKNQT